MSRSKWQHLLCTSLLLPAAALADEAPPAEQESAEAAAAPPETVLSLVEYEARWRLADPVDATAYIDRWPQSTWPFDIHVDDGSSLTRVTRIRSLSLLTIAGDERSKWFLGINEDGLVGIHFRGFTRTGARHHIDLPSLLAPDKVEDDAY